MSSEVSLSKTPPILTAPDELAVDLAWLHQRVNVCQNRLDKSIC